MTAKRTLTNLIKTTFREQMKKVGTSIPGHIISFDPATQLAQVQIGITRVNVNGERFEPPPLIKCPVHFTGGSEFIIEHQIDPDDECLIIFSQRCIDGWVNNGGIANNPILRYHEFDDAIVIPGVRSQPNKISNHENNGVRLRNKDGDKFIWLKNNGTAEITVDTLVVNGNIEHTGDTQQTGNTTQTGNNDVTGAITATTSVTAPQIVGTTSVASPSIVANGKEMDGHTHAGSPTAPTGPVSPTGAPT